MKKTILAIVMLTQIFAASAQEPSVAKPVPSVMYQFLNKVVALSPFVFKEKAFVADKNQRQIAEYLGDLKVLARELKDHPRLTTPGYEKSADYFIADIDRVHDSFTQGHKQYANRLFRSTLHACGSCHTQERSSRVTQWDFSKMALPQTLIEQAHLYYAVRSYDLAWKRYSKVVDSYGKAHNNQTWLSQALDRLLIICLRVDRDPAKLRVPLEKWLGKQQWPTYFAQQMGLWVSELRRLEKTRGYRFLDKTGEAFEEYINQLYREVYPFAQKGRSQKVVMEYATGMMFEFINNRPKEKTQGMLYWLGVSNFALDHFESSILGEQFLQSCIDDYQRTILSHRCFDALEEHWVLGFSGSSGVHLPADVKKKLSTYRKKLQLDRPWVK